MRALYGMTRSDTKKLYYPKTDLEICLGDRVSIRRLFRRRTGTVVYIPGASERHSDMEYGDVKLWAIQLDNDEGNILQIGYFPPDEVVPKSLQLIKREDSDDSPKLITPDVELN